MCMFCNWGELYPEDDAEPDADALERQRASQDSWARLMDEISKADAAAETARAGTGRPPE